jgi:hypothetical protein
MDISISFMLLALHIPISHEFQALAIGFPQRVAQHPLTLDSHRRSEWQLGAGWVIAIPWEGASARRSARFSKQNSW